MNYNLFDFVKVYQDDLLKSASRPHLPHRGSSRVSLLWDRFMIRLGDSLIALGKKVKNRATFADLSQEHV